MLLTFYFDIIVDSQEDAKKKKSTKKSLSSMAVLYITLVHYENQEIDSDIIQLTRLHI